MSFIVDVVRDQLNRQAAQVALDVEVEMSEGANDFLFGRMPRGPRNPNYMQGWLQTLQKQVVYEDGLPVYPSDRYTVDCTSDLGIAIFGTTPIAESAWKEWQPDF